SRAATRILEGALRTLPNVRSVRHVQTRHLHVLLQPQLEALDLTFGTGDVHRALELLRDRCTRLKRLNISYLRTVDPNILLGVTPNLTHLTVLDLSHTEANDTVMSAVGRHCPVLRDVNVSCCPISDRGPSRLFWDSHQKRRTCQLVTSVNMSGCPVSPAGVREMLQLQPRLRHAEHENSLLAFDRSYGYSWTDEDTYSILGLTATGAVVTDALVDTVVTACPYLTSLTLQNCNVSNSTLLLTMQLTQLTQLRLTNVSADALQFADTVAPLLSDVGQRLVSLLLTTFSYADVNLIAITCPYLENLALSDIDIYEPVGAAMSPACDSPHGSPVLPFQHLQALEVRAGTLVLLQRLLQHCRGLRNLLISGALCLTDSLLMDVWL
ncbi:Leucine-rich repeat, partial [Trinorchestia longiramus]